MFVICIQWQMGKMRECLKSAPRRAVYNYILSASMLRYIYEQNV